MLRNEKGFLGTKLLLILAILGGLAIWAYYKGYIKWKGPSANTMAQEMKSDVKKTVHKATK
jgi:hypothetical protein